MRTVIQVALWAACASSAFAQLDSYTVAVSATRTLTVQPDQVGISVSVTAPLGTDVLSLVQGAGITLANLSTTSANAESPVIYDSGAVANIDWNFGVVVPLTNLNSELAALSALQQTLYQQHSPASLNFYISGMQASPQLLASLQCPLTDLVADARAEGQILAQASGFTLGSVSAMSNTPLTSGQSQIGGAFTNVLNFYDGNPLTGILSASSLVSIYSSVATPNPTCTVTVKFNVAAPAV